MESISLIPVNDTEYNDLSTLTKLFRKNLLACSVVGIHSTQLLALLMNRNFLKYGITQKRKIRNVEQY